MHENEDAGPQYSIRAVDRVCNILDALKASADGVSLSELSRLAGMPKSSTLRYLAALEARDYVMKDPYSGLFLEGTALQPARGRYFEELGKRATTVLTAARDAFGETVNLGVLDGTDVRYVAVIESRRSVRLMTAAGAKDNVHSTAIGKVTLAQLDALRLSEIVNRLKLPAITPATITTRAGLLEEIRQTADRGFAADDCENQSDGRCVAVPVLGLIMPAGMSVSAPVTRLDSSEFADVATRLRRYAASLSAELRAIQL